MWPCPRESHDPDRRKEFAMRRVLLLAAISLALCLSLVACQRIEGGPPEPTYVSDAELSVVPGEFADAVPAGYGRLVNVELYPNRPRVALMWFESQEGDITLVRVDLQKNRIIEGVLRIPRR
jgi:hypothetical protein